MKKVTILFTLVAGLILSVAGVAWGSPPISASQPLPELPDHSAAISGPSEPHLDMMAAELKTCDVDFNHDGVVDVGDIMRVADCWRSTDPADIALYDLTDDGTISIVDIMLVAAQWGNHCPALFAIDMGGSGTDPTRRDLAAAAGFRLHRTSVSWASVEPTNVDLTNPANGNWPDSTFDIYRNDRRLTPYVIVMGNPNWAASKACGPIDSDDLDDFGEFVEQLVSRYADVTPYWIFYNEQDQWTTVPNDAGGCWGGHGVEYAQMLAVAWDAAHSADPNAQVIFGAAAYEPTWDGGTTWDQFFYRDAFQYMQANSDDDFVDIIAANQYNFLRDDWDRALPTYQEIIAKFRWAKDDDYFDANTAKAYSIYKWQTAYGLDKPMASGEVGLQVSTGPVGVPTMEELQARHAVHVNVRGMAAGLKIISWYTLVDKGGGELNYGLLRSETDPRPAYTAYQVLTEQLDGYGFDQQLAVSGNCRIQAYRFDKGGMKKLVLWRDEGQKIKLQSTTDTETMTISATELGTGWTGRVRVTDKQGGVSTYGSLGAPSVNLTFSSDPIYVEAY
jgi:hypothetical protein